MKLYNKDCVEVLKNIPDNSIDLIVTDCPYHIVSGGCSKGEYGNGNGIFQKEPSGIFERHSEFEYKLDKNGIRRKYIKGTNHLAIGGILDDCDFTTYARQGKLFKHNDIKFSDWLGEAYRVLKPQNHIYIYISKKHKRVAN